MQTGPKGVEHRNLANAYSSAGVPNPGCEISFQEAKEVPAKCLSDKEFCYYSLQHIL